MMDLFYMPNVAWWAYLLSNESVEINIGARYIKQRFFNRCEIKGPNKRLSLTIPVHAKDKIAVKDCKVDHSTNWATKHWRSLQTAYSSAPYWEDYSIILESNFSTNPEFLIDFTLPLLQKLKELLDLNLEIELVDKKEIRQNDRVILSKPGISPKNKPFFQDVSYEQLFGNNFESNLSVFDLLMNKGPESKAILKQMMAKS